MLIFTFYLVPNPKIILKFLNKLLAENFDGVNSAYNMFKYPVRGEMTRKYYEQRIRLFLITNYFYLVSFCLSSTRIIKAGFYPVILIASFIWYYYHKLVY